MGKENPRPGDWVQVEELDSLQMSYSRPQNDGVLTPHKGLSAWQNVLDEAEGEIRKQVLPAYLLTYSVPHTCTRSTKRVFMPNMINSRDLEAMGMRMRQFSF